MVLAASTPELKITSLDFRVLVVNGSFVVREGVGVDVEEELLKQDDSTIHNKTRPQLHLKRRFWGKVLSCQNDGCNFLQLYKMKFIMPVTFCFPLQTTWRSTMDKPMVNKTQTKVKRLQ
ncbi:hypothetical protein TYRP_023142 [Tyrophagus putrescentiae]|nr:hypothetical protein TYRP_023142 [Tyrophagus putrescentiae]